MRRLLQCAADILSAEIGGMAARFFCRLEVGSTLAEVQIKKAALADGLGCSTKNYFFAAAIFVFTTAFLRLM
jgi:hypothetical protein